MNVHEWNGHTIRVSCVPYSKALWLRNLLVVTVDDASYSIPDFYIGHTLRFTFQHEGQTVPGEVTAQNEQMYGSRMKYLLNVDGQRIANDKVTISGWHLNIVGWILTLVIFAGILGLTILLFEHYRIDKAIEEWFKADM